MAFLLERLVRGGRAFSNGRFHTYDAAVKQMQHGQQWHQANGTSSKFRILLEEEDRRDVTNGYTPPDEGDFGDLPPAEELPETRIKQLEEQLAKAMKLLEAKGEPVEVPVEVPQEPEEEAKSKRGRKGVEV